MPSEAVARSKALHASTVRRYGADSPLAAVSKTELVVEHIVDWVTRQLAEAPLPLTTAQRRRLVEVLK